MARIPYVLASRKAGGTPRLAPEWIGARNNDQAVVLMTGHPPDLLTEFRATRRLLGIGSTPVPLSLRLAGRNRQVALQRN